MTDNTALKAALAVMQSHIEAINARDAPAIAATLHFPHYRLSEAGMKVWDSPESYLRDFRARAGAEWGHSAFQDIRVLRASAQKVHLDAEIRRYRADGREYQRFRSLWVITCDAGLWAARLRSSFAPT